MALLLKFLILFLAFCVPAVQVQKTSVLVQQCVGCAFHCCKAFHSATSLKDVVPSVLWYNTTEGCDRKMESSRSSFFILIL